MQITDRTILIFGGSGLVGRAVARQLFKRSPRRIILVALYDDEVRSAAAALAGDAGATEITTEWGNVFSPAEAAQCGRAEMLDDDHLRELVISDLLGDLSEAMIERSYLFQLLDRHRPDAVIDCINTATAFAYQDVFRSARELLAAARDGAMSQRQVQEHILTLPMPQLIRHVQIAVEAMRLTGTTAYVKIGTSGTGGMGLNIPYTHSEERPSKTLLSKSAVAGAHSLLLFLVGRTPGAPATIEIKPTAAVAWGKIAYGPIWRGRKEMRRFDCPTPLPLDAAIGSDATGWVDTGSAVESVYVHAGENGLFAREEFETVSALGQMEFVTPEEVADYVVMELEGRPTGRNVVAALDAATAGPTYRGAILRSAAIERLGDLEREHGVRSIAFEMLGPPRLSKLLYEAFIWSRIRSSVSLLAKSDATALSQDATRLLDQDADLRSTIVSVGLPILLPSQEVYRGELILVRLLDNDLERTVTRGWIDLRREHCALWIRRAQSMVEQAHHGARSTGSDNDWEAIQPEDAISPSRMATWIFGNEDDGVRIKR